MTFSPGLAASATLGTRMKTYSTATRLRRSVVNEKRAQPPCGWDSTKTHYPG